MAVSGDIQGIAHQEGGNIIHPCPKRTQAMLSRTDIIQSLQLFRFHLPERGIPSVQVPVYLYGDNEFLTRPEDADPTHIRPLLGHKKRHAFQTFLSLLVDHPELSHTRPSTVSKEIVGSKPHLYDVNNPPSESEQDYAGGRFHALLSEASAHIMEGKAVIDTDANGMHLLHPWTLACLKGFGGGTIAKLYAKRAPGYSISINYGEGAVETSLEYQTGAFSIQYDVHLDEYWQYPNYVCLLAQLNRQALATVARESVHAAPLLWGGLWSALEQDVPWTKIMTELSVLSAKLDEENDGDTKLELEDDRVQLLQSPKTDSLTPPSTPPLFKSIVDKLVPSSLRTAE